MAEPFVIVVTDLAYDLAVGAVLIDRVEFSLKHVLQPHERLVFFYRKLVIAEPGLVDFIDLGSSEIGVALSVHYRSLSDQLLYCLLVHVVLIRSLSVDVADPLIKGQKRGVALLMTIGHVQCI